MMRRRTTMHSWSSSFGVIASLNSKACWTTFAVVGLMGLVSCTTGFPKPNAGNAIEAVSAEGGTPQSHGISGKFAVPLVAMVTTNGTPTSGVAVTFAAPARGASGTFADTGANSTTATTDLNGLATAAVFTANGTAGAYSVTASAAGIANPATFHLTNTIGSPAVVASVSGGQQGAVVGTPFPAPFVVTVWDSGHNPVSNATVQFTAPVTGPSGTFADTNSSSTKATTDANGVATAAAFTANGIAGPDTVVATALGAQSSASFTLTNMAGAAATITATGGGGQSVIGNNAFPLLLAATVVDNQTPPNPVAGAAVTFSAPTSGASGTFKDTGTNTTTVLTNSSGVATSTIFTANPTGGAYAVAATVPGVVAPASFNLTNWTAGSKFYSYFLSGQEASTAFYTLAGSVVIDPSGNVLAGEQDYNDAPSGITSPQPSGDAITGGTLTISPTNGRGKLTLFTNNPLLGPVATTPGTETLGVQFVNLNHALVIQFDGSATSSGSMDVQTIPSTPNGGFAFTLSGLDPTLTPVALGGVFSITGENTLGGGLVDVNDGGTVTTSTALSGTLSAPDSFGRGTITSTLANNVVNYGGAPVALNYYIVDPEVIRIIDVDSTDSAIGSAFGQGVNASTASNASLGPSVFGLAEGVAGTNLGSNVGAAGMFTPDSGAGTFSGYGDEDELATGNFFPGTTLSGTYSVASNGYGSLTIPLGSFGSISALGVYVTDPKLNLLDPNNSANSASGVGSALFVDLDAALAGGVGFAIPQTDTKQASFFKNTYAFGAQNVNLILGSPDEFDFVGRGTVSSTGTLSGDAILSDPLLTLAASAMNSTVSFSQTVQADPSNPGRYTLFSANATANPLPITIKGAATNPTNFDVVLYQASGGQLLWLNENNTGFLPASMFLGTLQQVGSLTGLPLAIKAGPKN